MIIWTHAYMESFIFILDEQHIQVYLTFLTLLIPYQNDYEHFKFGSTVELLYFSSYIKKGMTM